MATTSATRMRRLRTQAAEAHGGGERRRAPRGERRPAARSGQVPGENLGVTTRPFFVDAHLPPMPLCPNPTQQTDRPCYRACNKALVL